MQYRPVNALLFGPWPRLLSEHLHIIEVAMLPGEGTSQRAQMISFRSWSIVLKKSALSFELDFSKP